MLIPTLYPSIRRTIRKRMDGIRPRSPSISAPRYKRARLPTVLMANLIKELQTLSPSPRQTIGRYNNCLHNISHPDTPQSDPDLFFIEPNVSALLNYV